MGEVFIRPPIQRHSLIPELGLQIGSRGDRWEEEFIKNIDFSTMDDADDWSYLFRDSKANVFDLTSFDSSEVTNMDYMFQNTHAGTLTLAGLTIGAETSATNIFSGEFDAIDFTGAVFYSLPTNMLQGAIVHNGIQLRTLDVSHLTSLEGMFSNAELTSLDLSGFNISTITNVNNMFYRAKISTLTGLNTLDFSNVTTARNMFYESRIPVINLSGARFNSLIDAQYMFYEVSYYFGDSLVVTLDVSNTYFPVLENAYEMFYMYTNNYAPTNLVTDGITIISNGLNAGYMFAYLTLPEGVGLDLSGFTRCRLSQTNYMFSNLIAGETDFSYLDFSEVTDYNNAVFYYTKTPTIHIKTALPYIATTYTGSFFLTYGNRADEVILEIIMPSGVASFSNVVYPQSDESVATYLIKDSVMYASSLQNFINNYSGNVQVTFENSVVHVGENGSLYNFMYDYKNNPDSYVDMRDLEIDGIITRAEYIMGYPCYTNRIYFPNSGIKLSGRLYYLLTGTSTYDSSTQTTTIKCPTFYNLDKFDTSRVTSMYYLMYYCNGTYDLTPWHFNNLQLIDYLLYNCRGDFNLSGWDTSHVTSINSITSSFYGGKIDLSNWNLSNLTSLSGVYTNGDTIVDFNGWNIPIDRQMSNCHLFNYGSQTGHSVIYIPDTLFQPTSYQYKMFGGSSWNASWIVDVYTNATDIERQNWNFEHLYTEEEPWGYRLHLGSSHNEFLSVIGGD